MLSETCAVPSARFQGSVKMTIMVGVLILRSVVPPPQPPKASYDHQHGALGYGVGAQVHRLTANSLFCLHQLYLHYVGSPFNLTSYMCNVQHDKFWANK